MTGLAHLQYMPTTGGQCQKSQGGGIDFSRKGVNSPPNPPPKKKFTTAAFFTFESNAFIIYLSCVNFKATAGKFLYKMVHFKSKVKSSGRFFMVSIEILAKDKERFFS